MKQELPIAFILLAVGLLAWLWHRDSANQAVAAIQNDRPAENPTVPLAKPHVHQPSPIFIRRVAQAIQHGPARHGDIEIASRTFGKSMKLAGRFWQQGNGTRQSRLELIPESRHHAKITQICDGRIVYRLLEQQEKRSLKFHFLDRLNNEEAGIIQASLPAKWVSSGSISELLLNLAEAFQFSDIVQSSDLANEAEIAGRWNPNYLARIMVNRVHHDSIVPRPDWSSIPAQIPHGVKLVFSQTPDHGWQPSKILFFRFDDESSEKKIEVKTSISFGAITVQPVSPDLFQLNEDILDAIDLTDQYNERIDLMMGSDRVAVESGDSLR